MTTIIQIAFQDESAAKSGNRPSIRINGPALIPEVGEHVHCSRAMPLENPVRISGTVVLRSFCYEPDEVYVWLTLKDNYLHG